MKDTQEVARLVRQWMESFTIRSMESTRGFFKRTGLSMPQFHILTVLYYKGQRGVHDIGDRMEITSPAASQLIERLVQAGLVMRTENPEDRRARQIALTHEGRALLEKAMEERHRWVDELAGRLTAEEREAALAALPVLIAAEKRLGEPASRGKCP